MPAFIISPLKGGENVHLLTFELAVSRKFPGSELDQRVFPPVLAVPEKFSLGEATGERSAGPSLDKQLTSLANEYRLSCTRI